MSTLKIINCFKDTSRLVWIMFGIQVRENTANVCLMPTCFKVKPLILFSSLGFYLICRKMRKKQNLKGIKHVTGVVYFNQGMGALYTVCWTILKYFSIFSVHKMTQLVSSVLCCHKLNNKMTFHVVFLFRQVSK